jgi:dTDP-4-amino-4,6-dideoxygalactose transaminase/nucleoside-diphosphate-sugar epimerase
MRVLVTGGAGYIGSVIVPHLVASGHSVTVLDKFLFGTESLSEYIDKKKINVIKADVRDFEALARDFQRYDCIFHLAALSNDPSCELDPRLTYETNVRGTQNVADLAKQAGVPRFVLFSSCSVYGAAKTARLTESSLLNPISAYADSKVKAEEYLQSITDSSFRPTILRLATAFGGSPRMRFDLAINLMTLHARTKGRISIMGGGKQWRPFVHVKDVARLCDQLLEEPLEKIGNQTFNVGGDELNFQIAEIAKLVSELTNAQLDWPPDDPDKRSYRVSFEKIRQVLSFIPRYDTKFAVREISDQLKAEGITADSDHRKFYNIQVMRNLLGLPACEGGEPIRRDFLPFALPLLGPEEEREVIETLRSGWITTGPRTKRFEEKIARYVGADDCLALSSCTAGLHLALAALDIGPGHEVVTTSLTFCSTANVIEHTGAKPVFVDVDPKTLNINAKLIEEKITERTKAIMVVHMAGYPCDMDEIHAIAQRHNLPVIEDAAHAIGSIYKGKKIGTVSDFTCFSFYPIKNMTSIEGGAITCKNPKLMERLRRLALHGMDRDAWQRYSAAGRPHWSVEEPGFKYNMTDVQAAVGLHQIDRLDGFNEQRARIAAMYDDAFAELPGFSRPEYTATDRVTNNHLYIVKLDLDKLNVTRDELIEALKHEGIGTGIHFMPVHLHPFYQRKYKIKREQLPETSRLADCIFSMPLYPKMSATDIRDSVRSLQKLLPYYAKRTQPAALGEKVPV